MTRYHTPSGPEAEYQPGSRQRVLRNLLGLTSKVAMDRMEAEALVSAETYFFNKVFESTTQVTASLIREMHRAWLGDIYPWAGAYRTVEVTKEDFVWPPAYLIPQHMETLTRGILADYTPCRPGSLTDVCRSIATVHAELLLIHPFREGNGRLARWLADVMALQAGYPMPMYRFHGKGSQAVRKQYLQGVIQGYAQRYDTLSSFFEEAIERGASDAVVSVSRRNARGEAPSNSDDA